MNNSINLLMSHTVIGCSSPTIQQRTKTPISKDDFIFENIREAFLQRCDIPELKLFSETNKEWKKLADHKGQWQDIAQYVHAPSLENKEEAKEFFLKTNKQAHACFDLTLLSEDLRNELNGLYNSEKIADIKLLRSFCIAHDVLSVWTWLQEAKGGTRDLDLLFIDTCSSIREMLEKASEFHEWCEIHQEELASLQTLSLSGNKLTTIPPEIGKLTGLKNLFLYGNQISSLPPEIGNCTALEFLFIEKNRLTSLPPEIGKLKALKKLTLDDNELTSLPPEIKNLKALERLDLDNNQLIELPPEIGHLAGLQKLWVSGNRLTTLPPEFGNLTNLQKFCANDNQLTYLPSEFGDLTALQELHINKNQLKGLPREFRNLADLTDFSCDDSLKKIYAVQCLWWSLTDRCFAPTE